MCKGKVCLCNFKKKTFEYGIGKVCLRKKQKKKMKFVWIWHGQNLLCKTKRKKKNFFFFFFFESGKVCLSKKKKEIFVWIWQSLLSQEEDLCFNLAKAKFAYLPEMAVICTSLVSNHFSSASATVLPSAWQEKVTEDLLPKSCTCGFLIGIICSSALVPTAATHTRILHG